MFGLWFDIMRCIGSYLSCLIRLAIRNQARGTVDVPVGFPRGNLG